MTGFGALLQKELLEIRRTWRLWVLPGILLFMGLSSPILAQLTPALLRSLSASEPGLVIQLPEPTYLDAYQQWLKNLSQVVLFAVIISSAGLISSERKSGTLLLVLTKPVSRSSFVFAKIISALALLVLAVLAGLMLCWGGTVVLFGGASLGPLLLCTALWLVYGSFLLCASALFSVLLDGQAGAAGVGLALHAVVSLLGLWPPMLRYSPAGLMTLATSALSDKAGEALWPVMTGLLGALFCALLAASLFSRREL